jgi:hypothetical protein
MSAHWSELLMNDHQVTEKVLAAVDHALAAAGGPPPALVAEMLDYFATYVDRCHNRKEQDHLFPLIERRGIPREGGPLAVMLAEHERSRELVSELVALGRAYADGDRSRLPDLRRVFGEYAALLKDHFWKENDILYPMARRVLTADDDAAVETGIEATEAALGADTRARYYAMADRLTNAGEVRDLSAGLSAEVLAAMLNTLPVELSFVDADDRVRYFSHEDGTKIFPRTRGVIGNAVQNCHPKKSVHAVNQILADFKAGRREVAEFWIDMGERKIHIRYFPVRSPSGAYLGTLETVQDVTSIQKLSGQKRLLD